ncbi:hypothetical protein J0H58_20345 [bacterium]|nr:hypothetical protein [bacterium]
MWWPRRTWVAGALLAGHLFFPGAAGAIWLFTNSPPYEEIDWSGTSPAVRVLDVLLKSHVFYALALVVVMRGWRVQAVGVGVVSLAMSAVVNFLAYFHVSGVYF